MPSTSRETIIAGHGSRRSERRQRSRSCPHIDQYPDRLTFLDIFADYRVPSAFLNPCTATAFRRNLWLSKICDFCNRSGVQSFKSPFGKTYGSTVAVDEVSFEVNDREIQPDSPLLSERPSSAKILFRSYCNRNTIKTEGMR